MWRSWLAYLHGVQGVASSSLATPTITVEALHATLLLYNIVNIHAGLFKPNLKIDKEDTRLEVPSTP